VRWFYLTLINCATYFDKYERGKQVRYKKWHRINYDCKIYIEINNEEYEEYN
jgi:hypothetical protein